MGNVQQLCLGVGSCKQQGLIANLIEKCSQGTLQQEGTQEMSRSHQCEHNTEVNGAQQV